MRLVHITHYRCDDYDTVTFVLAPEEWSNKKIREKIELAQEKYESALREFLAGIETVKFVYVPTLTSLDPKATVQEELDKYEKQKVAYAEYSKKRNSYEGSFETFLVDEGFVSLWDGDSEALKADVQWGHQHGVPLRYGNHEETNTTMSVKKFASIVRKAITEYDEDDFD